MPTPSSSKQQALKASGTLNPRADQVSHPLFQQSVFFDPRDLVQLKYEALRALEADDYSLARAASEFGFSVVLPSVETKRKTSFWNRVWKDCCPASVAPSKRTS